MNVGRVRKFTPVVAALLFAACGSPDAGPVADEPPDGTVPQSDAPAAVDGDWVAISGVTDGVTIDLVEGRDVSLTIDGSSIGGTAACNSYGGEAEFGDGTIRVGDVSMTEMGCESPIQEIEQAYLSALTTFTKFAVLDDVLTLSSTVDGAVDEWVFERQVPIRDAALVGTTWVLDTLITGDAASNSPGMDAAFLEFAEDGRLTGSTGCRALEGEWSLQGTTVLIPTLTAIDDPTAGICAPESEALDAAFIAVVLVESGTTAGIDGSRLTLTAPGGDGLSFRAGEPSSG
jgi:heat shock protein HslJ